MHAKQLAQIATNFAAVGHAFTSYEVTAAGDAAHGFWLANRFRCDAWHQRVSAHRSAIERCGTSRRTRLWRDVIPTLQEILISEPLTRVVAYLASLLESRQADVDWGPLAHSVFKNHVEARNRCLNLMVFGHGFPVERAVKLNHLRRLMELYNDQLLAALPPSNDLKRFAFDLSMAANLQRDFRRYSYLTQIHQVRLHTLSISAESLLSFDYNSVAAHPQFNQSIAEGALGMLPAEVFDSFGVPRGRLRSMVTCIPVDSSAQTGDLQAPLVAPFDLFASISRQAELKSRRLGL